MASCPKCRFAGATMHKDAYLKCANCGHVYWQQLEFPPVPRNRLIPSPVGRMRQRKALIALVAVASVLLTFAVFTTVYFTRSVSSGVDSDQYESFETPTPRKSSAPKVKILQAKVGETILHGMNGSYPWWVVSYRNSGNHPIQSPRIGAKFYDGDGRHLKDADFGAYVLYLPPGETCWVFCSPTSAKTARKALFELRKTKPVSKYTREYRRLQVRDVRIQAQSSPALKDYPFVVGSIYNTTGSRVNVRTLQAIGYDENHEPCAYTLGNALTTRLNHRETTSFKLNTGAYVIRQPVRWEVDAWGYVME